MKKIDFFIIGAPKTATSALNLFLSKHKDVFMSRPKDTGYFCKDFHKQSDLLHNSKNSFEYFPIRTFEKYIECFKGSKKNQFLGESSTQYFHSKDAPKSLYEHNPDAKVILLLREPISHLVSLHGLLLNHGIETENDFNKALENSKVLTRKTYPKTSSHPYLKFYFPVAEMYTAVNRYYATFPKSQIKVVLFEDFKLNNRKVYCDILDFLDLSKERLPKFEGYNTRHIVKYPWLRLFFKSKVWKFFWYIPSRVLPIKFRMFLLEKYFKFNRKELPLPSVDIITKNKLLSYYSEDIEKTSNLIGMDLKKNGINNLDL